MRINKFFLHVDPGNGIHQWVKGSLGVGGTGMGMGLVWIWYGVCYGRWCAAMCAMCSMYSHSPVGLCFIIFSLARAQQLCKACATFARVLGMLHYHHHDY